MRFLDELVALGLLGTVGKQPDARAFKAVIFAHEFCAHVREIDELGCITVDIGTRIDQASKSAALCRQNCRQCGTLELLCGNVAERTCQKRARAARRDQSRKILARREGSQCLHQRGLGLLEDCHHGVVVVGDNVGGVDHLDAFGIVAQRVKLFLNDLCVAKERDLKVGIFVQCQKRALNEDLGAVVASHHVDCDFIGRHSVLLILPRSGNRKPPDRRCGPRSQSPQTAPPVPR